MSPVQVHPALEASADAAAAAYRQALREWRREQLGRELGPGADGTPTTFLDDVVDRAVLEALRPYGVNVLSEEAGWLDRGSALTLVIDPLDGTANAVAGVPVCAFAGALAVDGEFVEGLVEWIDLGRRWAARRIDPKRSTVSGRRSLDGASVAMLRPRPETASAWQRISSRAARVRVMGSSVIEACLVADGAVDAFVDPGGEVHRLVDLAAVSVIVQAAGGVVVDAFGRPIELDTDLTRRWSGVVAATPDLAADLAAAVTGSGTATRTPS